ncbi:MAG: helix-turn-helix domain-containing protein [Acidimicrobiales bacterium]
MDEAKERATEEIASYRLAELRRALGITQVELAALVGKSQSAISQLEHGEIGLSLETLPLDHPPTRRRDRDHRRLATVAESSSTPDLARATRA